MFECWPKSFFLCLFQIKLLAFTALYFNQHLGVEYSKCWSKSYTRQRMHKLPFHPELINLIGLAFHVKLHGGMLSKEGLFRGTMFSTKVTLGSFLPSMFCMVKQTT